MAQGMEIQALHKLVIDALEDVKAQDIAAYDTRHLTAMFDRVVIATGTSSRHAASLARNVADKARAAGVRVQALEGVEGGEWVLVDLGDMVIHVFQQPIRAYYALEEVWGGRKLPLHEPVPKPAKPAAKKAAPAKAAAKPAAGKSCLLYTSPSPRD